MNFMRGRSKGFTLTELLTALVIHSFFILMLGGTFYTLISFGSRSQMVMTARERGQRVINYIDSRVRNAGLGMWDLDSSDKICEALSPLTASNFAFDSHTSVKVTLPIVITHEYANDNDYSFKEKLGNETKVSDDGKTIYGNVLTILYAERETDNDKILVLGNGGYGIVPPNNIDVKNNGGEIIKTFNQYIYDFYNKNALASGTEKEIYRKIFDEFWKDFLKNGISSTIEGSIEEVIDTAYNSKIDAPEGVHEAVKAALDAVSTEDLSGDTRDGWQSVIEDLANYLISNDNFLPQFIETLKLKGALTSFEVEFEHEFLAGSNDVIYNNSDFSEGEGHKDELRSYGVLRGTGSPVLVKKDSLLLTNSKPVLSGDELLYLKCVRVYASDPTDYDKAHGQPLRNLRVQKLKVSKWGTNSPSNPYQQGILELYAELDTKKSILSVWVLSTGGRDRMTHERPSESEWPAEARWKDDYKYQVVYISKGTWILNNLHKGSDGEIDFTWN